MSNVSQQLIEQLVTAGNVPIVNLNANWTSKPYSMEEFLHLGIHLFWSDAAVQGTLYLDYSCDPLGGLEQVLGWSVKNLVSLDGTFDEQMFLDSNLPVNSFRLRFEYTSGTATLTSYILKKRG